MGSCNLSLFINSSETNRKEPQGWQGASVLLGVPERVRLDHRQGAAFQAVETPVKLEGQNLYPSVAGEAWPLSTHQGMERKCDKSSLGDLRVERGGN